jgi:hypothetical protein
MEAKKEVWIAGHEIPVAPSFQVEPAPIGRQRPCQRGFAALARANNGNAGKRREILGKKGLTGSLHALQNKTNRFEMQGIRGVLIPARQPLSPCFPTWNRE